MLFIIIDKNYNKELIKYIQNKEDLDKYFINHEKHRVEELAYKNKRYSYKIYYKYHAYKIRLMPTSQYCYKIYDVVVLNHKNKFVERIGIFNPHVHGNLFKINGHSFIKNSKILNGKLITIDPFLTINWLKKKACPGVIAHLILEMAGLLKSDFFPNKLFKWYLYLKTLH